MLTAAACLLAPVVCLAEEQATPQVEAPAAQTAESAPAAPADTGGGASAAQADTGGGATAPAPGASADTGGGETAVAPAASADTGGGEAAPAPTVPDGTAETTADPSDASPDATGADAETPSEARPETPDRAEMSSSAETPEDADGSTEKREEEKAPSSAKKEADAKAAEQKAAAARAYSYNRSSYSGVAADRSSQRKIRRVLLTDATSLCIEALNALHKEEKTAEEIRKGETGVAESKAEEKAKEKSEPQSEEPAENTIEIIGDWEPSLREKLSLESLLRETRKAGCHIGLVMIDIQSGQGIAVNPQQKFYSASSVKGPFVISLAALYPKTLEKQKNAFKAVAVNSENGSYSGLVNVYGRRYYNAWCEAVGVDAPLNQGHYARISAEELARLWLLSYQYINGNPTYGEVLGELFETPNRSAIRPVLGEKYRTQTKAGWIAERSRTAADAGIVYADESPYILALISDYPANLKKLEPYVEMLDSMHETMTAEYVDPDTGDK